MSKQIFVPLSDDLVFDRPDLINGPVVAYSPGMICSQWLNVEINPDEGDSANSTDTHEELVAVKV